MLSMFGKWFSRRAHPNFWTNYQVAFHKIPGKTPLREIPFAVFDTETTGLHPGKDRILSIGGVRVSGGAIAVAESLDIQLVQEVKPQQEDIAIHGILPSTHAGQKTLEEALACFLDWIGPAVLVGHHVRFDTTMVNKGLKQCGGGNLRNPSLDTVTLAMRVMGKPIYDNRENWSLESLAAKFNIPLHDRHTAAGDAFITGILLLKLLERLERRGIHTLKSLLLGN